MADRTGRRRPLVLLGEFSAGAAPATPYLERNGWGRMWVTKGPFSEYPGEPYGLDNGAFSAWRKGRPWEPGPFLRLVERSLALPYPPAVAVTPDVVAGGLRSLEFSLAWRDRLPDEVPWYLAVQDGMTPADVAPHAGRFAGVFLGGTDAFKRTVAEWREFSRGAGLPLHWGRCGTARRAREAVAVGVDSLDSVTPVLKIGEGRKHLMDRFEAEVLGRSGQRDLWPEGGGVW